MFPSVEAVSAIERSRRVLVVEDTAEIREILEELLLAEGYDVETAENGQHALDRLRNGAFDLILLDLMMPVMDGLELLTHLRGLRSPPAVVAMSAFERFRDDAQRLGADGFLVKPVDVDLLLQAVDRTIRR